MSTWGRSLSVDISTKGYIYIFACHTSPSCVICFVASLTKIWLNSINNLHFTSTEPYGNYVTECEATPTAAPQPMMDVTLESMTVSVICSVTCTGCGFRLALVVFCCRHKMAPLYLACNPWCVPSLRTTDFAANLTPHYRYWLFISCDGVTGMEQSFCQRHCSILTDCV